MSFDMELLRSTVDDYVWAREFAQGRENSIVYIGSNVEGVVDVADWFEVRYWREGENIGFSFEYDEELGMDVEMGAIPFATVLEFGPGTVTTYHRREII